MKTAKMQFLEIASRILHDMKVRYEIPFETPEAAKRAQKKFYRYKNSFMKNDPSFKVITIGVKGKVLYFCHRMFYSHPKAKESQDFNLDKGEWKEVEVTGPITLQPFAVPAEETGSPYMKESEGKDFPAYDPYAPLTPEQERMYEEYKENPDKLYNEIMEKIKKGEKLS